MDYLHCRDYAPDTGDMEPGSEESARTLEGDRARTNESDSEIDGTHMDGWSAWWLDLLS